LVSYLLTALLLVAVALFVQRSVKGVAVPRRMLVMRATVGEALDGVDRGEAERRMGVQILTKSRTLSKFSSVLIRGPIDELPSWGESEYVDPLAGVGEVFAEKDYVGRGAHRSAA